jgi:hypothetical protein
VAEAAEPSECVLVTAEMGVEGIVMDAGGDEIDGNQMEVERLGTSDGAWERSAEWKARTEEEVAFSTSRLVKLTIDLTSSIPL